MLKLCPAFSCPAAFAWFVLLLWGVLLSTQPLAVSSYLNALGLSEGYQLKMGVKSLGELFIAMRKTYEDTGESKELTKE